MTKFCHEGLFVCIDEEIQRVFRMVVDKKINSTVLTLPDKLCIIINRNNYDLYFKECSN
jgi:hypothetical protein